MSYDDYARHIFQKYRLAVSIAVLKSKPTEITLEDYIKQLKDKICEEKMDSDDLSIDICSDDFLIDETDDFGNNIDDTDRNNDLIVDDVDRNNDLIVVTSNFNNKTTYQAARNDVDIIETQDLNNAHLNIVHKSGKTDYGQSYNDENDEIYHQSEANDVDMINMEDLNDSISILENFYEADAVMNDMIREGNDFEDIFELNKDIDDNTIEKAASKKNPSQLIHNSQSIQTSDRIDITQCLTDNDATLCESVDILPNKQTQLSQEYNHNLDLNVEFLNTVRNTEVNILTNKKETKSKDTKLNTINKSPTASKRIRHYRHTKEFKNVYQNVAEIFDTKKNKTEDTKALKADNFAKNDKSKETPKDLQDTVMLTIPDEFLDNTHYSESQDDFIVMNEKFIHGTNKLNKTNNVEDKHKAEVPTDSDIFSQQTQATSSVPSININKKSNDKCNNTITDEKKNNRSDEKCTKIQHTDIDNDMFSQETQLTNFLTQSTNDSSNHRNKEAKEFQRQNAKNNIKDNEKDVFSQETQFTDFLTQSSTNDSQIFDSNNDRNKEVKEFQRQNAKNNIKDNEKDVFSQETQFTDFLTQSSTNDSQIFDSNNDRNKEVKEFQRQNAKNNIKDNEKDVFSQETQLTNFLTQSTNDSDNHRNKAKEFQRQNAKNNMKDNEKDVFSQETQLTDFLTQSTNDSQIFDSNKEAIREKITRGNVKHLDYDLFSQETQLTNFSTLSMNSQNITENSLIFSQDAQKMDEYLDQHEKLKFENDESKEMSLNKNNDFGNMLVTDKIKRCAHFDNNLESVQSTNKVKTDKNSGSANFDSVQMKEHTKPFTKFDNKPKNTPMTDESCTNFDNTQEEMEEEWTDSQIELIPFKVIEELNKVKKYINRKIKMSVESGYRSDSQSKTSLEMSQSSGWLNQAAHSLFDYLSDCPLVVTTQEVTDEISVVLGQLIDRLHEEERYPSFLEELLEMVQSLVGIVYGGTNGRDVLQNKDETFQRILLLNKSIHIQKYTIEKITHILENLHTELCTSNSLYEIKNIDQIENICYVFHILEIILHKYNKCSQNLSQSTQNLSQSTQNSQEEKVLKKSNITDIWRKKWNPNYKNCSTEGSLEKVCALTVCSAVLNKLIVGCMDGYSLISYFALKCFNVMQT